MKQVFVVFVCIIIFALNTFAQKYDKDLFEKNFNNAESLLEKGDFTAALLIYKELLQLAPENANLNFKAGFCYINTVLEKAQAISYLQKAVKNVNLKAQPELYYEESAPVEAFLYLAKAYHLDYKFEKALLVIDTIKTLMPDYKTEFIENIDDLAENCNYGIALMKYPVKMFVTNLGGKINSEFDEHSPVFTADESTLIFTSKRKGSTGEKITEDGQCFEDIYLAQKKEDGSWSDPVSISSNINTTGHEASIGLSVDGQELFIYIDESNVVNEKDGNIYYSKLDGEIWSKPIKLGPTINTKFNENHASLSADGTMLYFTSDKPGGYGGMDIYTSNRLPNGDWAPAQNLGTIVNSAEDEIGPYIHPDGVTLFFSSKSHTNMGGFDIFFTSKDEEGVWPEPTNIGYPINTTSDDIFYTPTPDGKRGYYASQQAGGIGRNDIYLITLPESDEKSLTVMSGLITMADGTPLNSVSITVTDKDTKEVVGTYIPNSKTGKYLFILKAGKNYNVTIDAEGFLPFTDNLMVKEGTTYQQIQKAIKLEPILLGKLTKEFYFHFEPSGTQLNDKETNNFVTISKILNFADKYSAEIILPSDNSNADLNNIRAEIIKENLTDNKIPEGRIKVLKKPSGTKESLVLYIVTDKNENNTTQNQIKTETNTDIVNKINSENGLIIESIFFKFDKYSTKSFIENLNNLSQWLVLNPDAVIEITGNTDNKGSFKYNKTLSLKRANFVKKYLIGKGAKKEQLNTKGEGEKNPIAKNIDVESRKLNRRVEFKLLKEGKTPITFKPVEIPEQYKNK
jgi:outer membrane protein OmpA-like peptidoglycan-associated protein